MKLRNRLDETGRIARQFIRRYRMKDVRATRQTAMDACLARYDALTKSCRF